jgi:hypothetical protein
MRKPSKLRPSATISRAQSSAYRYRFFEKVSALARVKIGKKFPAPQSVV